MQLNVLAIKDTARIKRQVFHNPNMYCTTSKEFSMFISWFPPVYNSWSKGEMSFDRKWWKSLLYEYLGRKEAKATNSTGWVFYENIQRNGSLENSPIEFMELSSGWWTKLKSFSTGDWNVLNCDRVQGSSCRLVIIIYLLFSLLVFLWVEAGRDESWKGSSGTHRTVRDLVIELHHFNFIHTM